MTIRIHDSLTQERKDLVPLVPGKIGMYVCGVTVYDYCHLGHSRFMVIFDTVARYLRYRGYEVTYVRNITDIDDKIINRANERAVDYRALTEEFTRYMHEDLEALGCEPPTIEPRATAYIEPMIDIIKRLDAKGFTYPVARDEAGNSDVYYRVRKFADYGKLSNRSVDDLISGERVDVDDSKEDPLDFVLWKASKPGEPSWPSPWGEGRPGWHIECSAMSGCCLGETFDIHAGGMDLKFPHHENEIAQSEAASGKTFANIWMHNGFVQNNDVKMSKSLNNFKSIRDVLDTDSNRNRMGEIIRYMILGTHYRRPLNFAGSLLDASKASLERMYMAMDRVARASDEGVRRSGLNLRTGEDELERRFQAVMDDDFNTAEALAVLHECVTNINKALDADETDEARDLAGMLTTLATPLGLLRLTPGEFLGTAGGDDDEVVSGMSRSDVEARVAERIKARADRDFALADSIRDELDAAGITIEDVPGADSTWRLKA